MEAVSGLLGYDYAVHGEIVHGHALGRTIGVPTINQIPPAEKLLPPFGVYVSEVKIEGKFITVSQTSVLSRRYRKNLPAWRRIF